MTAMTASAPMTAMTIMTDRGELPVDRKSRLHLIPRPKALPRMRLQGKVQTTHTHH